MIAVFAAMLAERRIIFTSQRLDRVSSCVQAANAFLYPMVWQHIFIPILPLKMKEILCAPMPYLIGVPEAVLETVRKPRKKKAMHAATLTYFIRGYSHGVKFRKF